MNTSHQVNKSQLPLPKSQRIGGIERKTSQDIVLFGT